MAVRKITIYRLTATTDTISNVADKVVFNGSKDTKTQQAFITNYEIGGTAGIGDPQPPEAALGGKQFLGKMEDLYTFFGFLTVRDAGTANGLNTNAVIMDAWEDGNSRSTNWKAGRFGVEFEDFGVKSIIPVRTGANQVGLLFKDLVWKNEFSRKPLQAHFTIRFTKKKGDDN